MLRCRRVGISWWKRSGTSICTSLSWLSKCPRSRLHPVVLAGAGFLWCRRRAEQLVEVPTIVSCSSLRGLVEQNVYIPVPHGRGGGRFPHDLRPHSPGAADEVFTGFFFALFSSKKKVRSWVRTRGRNWPRTLLHGRRRLMACPRCPRRTSRSQCWRSSSRRRTSTNGWTNSAAGGSGRRFTLDTSDGVVWVGRARSGLTSCRSCFQFWGVFFFFTRR